MTDKNNVYKSYDKIAEWFDEHRSRELFEKPFLDEVVSYLKPGSKVLDIGCGMGEPIGKYFIDEGFDLTGTDASSELLDLATKRFPNNRFILEDMRKLNLNEQFDCLIAWNSLFHLPHADQRKMFSVFSRHLSPEGILIFTSGEVEGEIWSDNGGENLYHASLSIDEYKTLLEINNFEFIKYHKDENIFAWIARNK